MGPLAAGGKEKERREKREERWERFLTFPLSHLLKLHTKSIGEFNQKHVVWFDTEQVS
jgi:hypothetical protein